MSNNLNFNIRFKADDAIHDDVEFILGNSFIFYYSKEDIEKLINSFGNLGLKDRPINLTLNSLKKQSGWIFTSSIRNYRVSVRNNKLSLPNDNTIGKPLFDGFYRFNFIPRTQYLSKFGKESSEISINYKPYFINFEINTNPSQFIRHHVLPNNSIYYKRVLKEKNESNKYWHNNNLLTENGDDNTISKISLNGIKEFCYDDSENWLDNTKWGYVFGNFAKAEEIRKAEKIYFEKIVESLYSEFQRATKSVGIFAEKYKPIFHLKKVETYWDLFFDTDFDLFGLFYELEQHLLFFNSISNKENSENFTNVITYETIRNTTKLILPLKHGKKANIKLIVYVKTNSRIRFQIRHEFNPKMAHRNFSFEKFNEILSNCRQEAADWLNKIFTYFNQTHIFEDFFSVSNKSASAIEFLNKVLMLADNRKLGFFILNCLIYNNRLVTQKNLRLSCFKLKQAGVLRFADNKQSSVYKVAEKYKNALRILKNKNG